MRVFDVVNLDAEGPAHGTGGCRWTENQVGEATKAVGPRFFIAGSSSDSHKRTAPDSGSLVKGQLLLASAWPAALQVRLNHRRSDRLIVVLLDAEAA